MAAAKSAPIPAAVELPWNPLFRWKPKAHFGSTSGQQVGELEQRGYLYAREGLEELAESVGRCPSIGPGLAELILCRHCYIMDLEKQAASQKAEQQGLAPGGVLELAGWAEEAAVQTPPLAAAPLALGSKWADQEWERDLEAAKFFIG